MVYSKLLLDCLFDERGAVILSFVWQNSGLLFEFSAVRYLYNNWCYNVTQRRMPVLGKHYTNKEMGPSAEVPIEMSRLFENAKVTSMSITSKNSMFLNVINSKPTKMMYYIKRQWKRTVQIGLLTKWRWIQLAALAWSTEVYVNFEGRAVLMAIAGVAK